MENVKAGVSGGVGDVPAAPTEAPQEDFPEPQTITSGGGDFDYNDVPDAPSAPAAPSMQSVDFGPAPAAASMALDTDKIHEIIEKVVSERWEDMTSKMGDLVGWKQKVDMNILGTKQEVIRVSGRLENLQNSILGKVGDYDKGIRGIHSEMKALEKVFEKILEPLISNVKALEKITSDLSKVHRK